MRKILWINYIYLAIYVPAITIVMIDGNYGAAPNGVARLFGASLPLVTLIPTVLFFKGKIKFFKRVLLFLNALLCFVVIITIFLSPQQLLQASFYLAITMLPFFINTYVLYKGKYKKLLENQEK